ncbi:MAG: hypothetical protein RBR69_06570 [Candidatus Cloacimonadaceae bacterium]|nr:hypothetical protein [Candidatus Cloacimonadaceae bacterium]
MASLWDSRHCVAGVCYLKYRPYGTQGIVWQLLSEMASLRDSRHCAAVVCYLKWRPYRTQGIVWQVFAI